MSRNKTGKLRALIVDDEKAIREFISVTLSSSGYAVAEAATGKEAIISVTTFRPDVVILDLGLPDTDGGKVIQEIRTHSQIPIIVVSVRENQHDKIEALDRGADDYLTKPFEVQELQARLRAVVRRAVRIEDEPIFKTGDLSIDLAKRIVKSGNKIIELTPTEYDLLKLLILHAGKVLTHRQILTHIWNKNPDQFEGIDHLLRVTISNLRGKIESNPARPRYIITEPAIGYRFKDH